MKVGSFGEIFTKISKMNFRSKFLATEKIHYTKYL